MSSTSETTKHILMKKFILCFLLVALAVRISAQTLSFSVTTPPCNHNGILTSFFTGLTPPLTVTYVTQGTAGTTIVHTGVTGLTDALTSYSGGPLYEYAIDAGGAMVSNYYNGAPPFTYTLTPTSPPCPGSGSDNATVVGGTPPYTYQWYNLSTMSLIGTSNPIAVPAGYYGAEITDAAGCVYGAWDQNDSMAGAVYSIPSFSVTATTTTANCTNGTASSAVSSGAVFPLTYAWSNGAATPSISGLVMGYYNVTVTDALGCSGTAYASVPQAITVTAPVVATPATCTAIDGSVIAFGSGGVPPYNYIWSNGATTQSQTGIASGNYDVAVTDANGCIGSGYGYVGITTPITVSYSTTPTLCTSPTGSATLKISGGTAPYSTLWYTTPPQTGITAATLPQGNFAFRVTDAMGCVQTGSATVPPIDVITASFTSVPSICTLSTGSMTAAPAGGVTPYHFAWSNGATTATMGRVPTGWYHVTITDNLGCTAKFSEYLPFNSTLGVGLVATPATCVFVNDGILSAIPFGGTPPYHYAWTGGGSTGTIISLPPLIPYWVTVTDALGCWVVDSTTLPADTLSSCYCTITGTVFNDANGDCIQDPGENGIPDIKINISGRGYTFTDASGHYSYKVPAGTYTVSENVLAFYPLSPCQVNNVSVTAAPGTGCTIPVDFANALDTIHDMHICTWDINLPVPGHTYTQVVNIKNNGTIPEHTVFSGYKTDGQLFAPISFIPSGYYRGASNYYNTIDSFPVVYPGNTQTFLMTYNVPTNIPLGTSVVFKDSAVYDTPMVNWLVDYSPWNNVNYFTTTIVSSFDPNFKEVNPKGSGTAGIISSSDSVLEYMVHFQNTGTYHAENIRVVDTLDDNLDWTTLVPLTMSTQCHVTVDQVGTRRVATFMFNNINLPPVSQEPVASNGMLSYSIRQKHGLPLGTTFKNSASIYFDYNAPVKTNQTLNTLGSARTGVSNNTSAPNNSFIVFPNPASTSFSAIINSNTAGAAFLTVSDVTGKTLMSREVIIQKGAQNIAVNVNQLSAGVYFVNFRQNNQSQTQKLVVIKQ